MNIGIPKEIKDREGRVALTPQAVQQLVAAGHAVHVQAHAGEGAGFQDAEYLRVGAVITTAAGAWDNQLVIKVKEPLESEYGFLKDQLLFTFLHLAGAPRTLTETLLARNTSALAYETLEDAHGGLPLLAPMSAVAGNMAALVGGYYQAQAHGGKGVQLGKVQDQRYGKVLIIGDGVVAYHAASSVHGLGAQVVLAGLDPHKGALWAAEFGAGFTFVNSSPDTISAQLADTDLVIGCVLRRGAKADFVVTEAQVQGLQPGSVVVDVSIDQGGCIETSRPTSHSRPVYVKHGVIHYCVANMPGAYPRTATAALSAAVIPYALRLAHEGLAAFVAEPGLAKALNTYQGRLTIRPVAEELGLLERYAPYAPRNLGV